MKKLLLFFIFFLFSASPAFADIGIVLSPQSATLNPGEQVSASITGLPNEDREYFLSVSDSINTRTSLKITTTADSCFIEYVFNPDSWVSYTCYASSVPFYANAYLDTSKIGFDPSTGDAVYTLQLSDSGVPPLQFTVKGQPPTPIPTPTPLCSKAAGNCSKDAECQVGAECTGYTCEGAILIPGDIPFVLGRCKNPSIACKKEGDICNNHSDCTGAGAECSNYRCLYISGNDGTKVCKPQPVPPIDFVNNYCGMATQPCYKNDDCQIGSTCASYTCQPQGGIGPIGAKGYCKSPNASCQKEGDFCNNDSECQSPGGACGYFSCQPINASSGTKICRLSGVTISIPIKNKLLDCNKIGGNSVEEIKKCEECVGDPNNPQGIPSAFGCIRTSPGQLIGSLFGIILGLAGGIALVLIIYSGYRMMVSAGNPEALQGARETLTSAIIGLLFIIFSFVILQVIGFDILQIPGFGN